MINISKTKNIIIFLIIILINCNVQSQVFDGNLASKSLKWTLEQKDFTSPPRVGIDPISIKLWDNYGGTSSPSSYGSLLEINGRAGHLVSQMYFKSTWEGGRILYRSAFYNQTTWDEWRTLLDSKSDVESDGLLKIKGAGNNYIKGNVDVRGVISTPEIAFRNADGGDDSDPYRLRKVQGSSNNNWLELQLNDDSNESFRIYGNSCQGFGCGEYSSNLYHSFDAQGNVYHSGNVGIGTTAPDEKLTVKGKIHAQEVRVDLQGACAPDYVFQKYYTGKSDLKSDYTMPTLAEIESFTKKNHHLPNVPSAQEVQQNGVSLGQMSNVLLQKVEELTLYAIEQNKVIEELKAQVTALMEKKQ